MRCRGPHDVDVVDHQVEAAARDDIEEGPQTQNKTKVHLYGVDTFQYKIALPCIRPLVHIIMIS